MADEPEHAFPLYIPSIPGAQEFVFYGMSLRDYFAAAAMQGALSRESWSGEDADIAKGAYQMADAMMKARKQQKRGE